MSTIKLFETSQVRSQWDTEKEAWFFSIVDVIAVSTDSPKARTYWSVLKNRLKKEGSELATNCSQLKMRSADGKNYLTDVADTKLDLITGTTGHDVSYLSAQSHVAVAFKTVNAE